MKAWAVLGAMGVGTAMAALLACGNSGSDATESGNGALSSPGTTNPVACTGTTTTKPAKASISCKMSEGPDGNQETFDLEPGPEPNTLVASGRQFRSVVIRSLEQDKTDFSTFQVSINHTHDDSPLASAVGTTAALSKSPAVLTLEADEDGLNREAILCSVK